MIKAVIFDLDDTLIDESVFAFSAFKEISEYLSIKFNEEPKLIYDLIVKIYKYNSKKVFNQLFEIKGYQLQEKELNRLIHIYRNHIPSDYWLDPYTERKLKLLQEKGIFLGIITDGFKVSQNTKIKQAKLPELFDKIIITDEYGKFYWKPNERAYRDMQKHLDVPFSSMIYIGDNLEKDFQAPKKLGMQFIHYNNPNSFVIRNQTNSEKYDSIITVNSKEDLFSKLFKVI